MTHSKVFLRTRDIDWAVKIGKDYIHVASAGEIYQKLSMTICSRYGKNLRKHGV